ncbi:hypothetical protein MT340_010790 [Staphylococcus sp. NRL 16/872]|uniref:hypothetical protein n=1 Tax=Staphylococcus sp. NRL 16/872 TaxID=2930131 RepID=UPI001FB2C68C|nr:MULTISPECIES: hypothetical protein [unclassified Staphylococcus]MCJ1657007.1 hypothetical protein [Staphylococcus sp. NRL 21/187]MCJ1662754.1 hypothetical protein [Staphylococcus sp. NRL 18/288]MCJ1668863.1 hypothetical protein [Staphylococcus sp. NRL 19/737]WEN69079.1 hypothetical protein MT340_010790 [Staphylococcus sp. NRL 16/872]
MNKKYLLISLILIIIGIYYVLGVNNDLDDFISSIITRTSLVEFIMASFIITVLSIPFNLYTNSKIKQINKINEKFSKEKVKPDFNMEQFKQTVNIPSKTFIYKGILPIVLLVGLGLKISNHFTLPLPFAITLIILTLTFVSTIYYSSIFLKNIIKHRYIQYTVSIILSIVMLYIMSLEEQLFLILFSITLFTISHMKTAFHH